MVESVKGVDSVIWVELEEFADEIFGVGTDAVPLGLVERVLTREHRLNNFLVVLPVKWRITAKEDIQDDSSTP